jgi:hypothetical protein
VTFTIYPNQLAPWFLIPVLVAYVVRAGSDGADRRCALGLGAAALLLGETHPMYAVYASMIVGPVLVLWCARRWWRREDDRRAALACCAALAIGLGPFPIVSWASVRSIAAADRVEATAPKKEAKPVRLSGRFVRFDNGLVMHKLGRGFTGGRGLRVIVLIMAGALAVMAGRGRAFGIALAILVMVAVWLHVPPLCSVMVKTFGAEWMVLRFSSLQDVIFALLVPGSLAAIAETAAGDPARHRVAWPLYRWGLGGVGLFAGAHFAHQRPPYTWPKYVERAMLPAANRIRSPLTPLLRFGVDLQALVPEGAVVLAEPSIGTKVVMMHDCHIVATDTSSLGVPGLGQRLRDIKRMRSKKTPADERDELLARYGVTHLVSKRPVAPWVMDRVHGFWRTEFGWCIVELGPAGEGAPATVIGDYDLALADAGRHEEAIALLERKIDIDPEGFGLHFRLGNALLAVDRPSDALVAFDRARQLRPDNPRPVIMIGNAHAELGQLAEAEQAYLDTIVMAEQRGNRDAVASGWFNLGNMYFRAGAWTEAIDAYDNAVRANPQHGGASYWRDEARRARRDGTDALQDPSVEPGPISEPDP